MLSKTLYPLSINFKNGFRTVLKGISFCFYKIEGAHEPFAMKITHSNAELCSTEYWWIGLCFCLSITSLVLGAFGLLFSKSNYDPFLQAGLYTSGFTTCNNVLVMLLSKPRVYPSPFYPWRGIGAPEAEPWVKAPVSLKSFWLCFWHTFWPLLLLTVGVKICFIPGPTSLFPSLYQPQFIPSSSRQPFGSHGPQTIGGQRLNSD